MWRASTCTWKRRNVRISHSMRALQAMRENVCRASVQACMSEIHLKYWLSCDWCAHVYRILFFISNSMRVFGQLARITEVELILMHACVSYWFAYAFDARKTPLLMHLFLWVYGKVGLQFKSSHLQTSFKSAILKINKVSIYTKMINWQYRTII